VGSLFNFNWLNARIPPRVVLIPFLSSEEAIRHHKTSFQIETGAIHCVPNASIGFNSKYPFGSKVFKVCKVLFGLILPPPLKPTVMHISSVEGLEATGLFALCLSFPSFNEDTNLSEQE
jgi:hypothetical protein